MNRKKILNSILVALSLVIFVAIVYLFRVDGSIKQSDIKDEAWREAVEYSEKMLPRYRDYARTDFYNGYMKAKTGKLGYEVERR